MSITATYSPEDNKIRLYTTERLDPETYARVKDAGFIWAPVQKIFVAPRWTPQREDLATQLAGDIEPEEMTLAERAAAKAERLETLATRRAAESDALQARADDLSQAFCMGQPILVGHHSERRARKDQERMHAAMRKSAKLHETANYWLYRAEGVEAHANYKNNPRTRANRIKTLLTELRDLQRDINNAHAGLAIWAKVTKPDAIRYALGNMDSRKLGASYGLYSDVDAGRMAPEDARTACMAGLQRVIDSPNRRRWIEHILHRMAYERSLLGAVRRHDGQITAVILQAFMREHGAEKPQASPTDPDCWQVTSPAPLPLHLADGDTLDLHADEWCDLMQACGYEVPEPKPRRASGKPTPPPLINPTLEDAERLQALWNSLAGVNAKPNQVRAIDQARYSAHSGGSYSPYETVEIDATGARVSNGWRGGQWVGTATPVARVRCCTAGMSLYGARAVVHITDKPDKPLPVDWVPAQDVAA